MAVSGLETVEIGEVENTAFVPEQLTLLGRETLNLYL